MPTCFVKNCKNRSNTLFCKKVAFHYFPRDPELQAKWLEACGRDANCNINKYARVCEVHFLSDCYETPSRAKLQRKLKAGSVPTEFLHLPKQRVKRINVNVGCVAKPNTCIQWTPVCSAKPTLEQVDDSATNTPQADIPMKDVACIQSASASIGSFVKQEGHDKPQTREPAMEGNRAEMPAPSRPPIPPNAVDGMNILSRLPDITLTASTDATNLVDKESVHGRFGWITIGKDYIPYIIRSDKKYCAVRMLELKVLNKYLTNLHQDVYTSSCVQSYYITEVEGRLLNAINFNHCDYQFGREPFTPGDRIVHLSDAIEFHNFLDTCYNKLLNGSSSPSDRCGFIFINKESVVPYTVYNSKKYAPIFYFDGEMESLQLKAEKLEGWALSYLKFCCKVQGIRKELYEHDSCAVFSLNDIKNNSPPGTSFEDYWPSNVGDSQLLIRGNTRTQMGQWTRQPAGPPPMTLIYLPPATQATVANSNQLHNVRQPAYPALQPRIATSTNPSTAATSHQRPSYRNIAPAPPPLIRTNQPLPLIRTNQL